MTLPAWASLEKIHIKNLDLTYAYPQGAGEFEGLSIGVSKHASQPVEIIRREEAFEIISSLVSFEWMRPFPFVHNVQEIKTQKFNLKLGLGESFSEGEMIHFRGEKTGDFSFENYGLKCSGPSVDRDPLERIKSDCVNSLIFKAQRMELPFNFLQNISEQLPDMDTESELDMPADNLSVVVDKGELYGHIRIKYLVRAYLKFWGRVQYENEGKTLAIRLDTVRFGILPVTSIVLKAIANQVNNPDVKVDPPWVRINLEHKK